jgi:hypothetical protein
MFAKFLTSKSSRLRSKPVQSPLLRRDFVQQVSAARKRGIDHLRDQVEGVARSDVLRVHPELEHDEDRSCDHRDRADHAERQLELGHGRC